MKALGGHCAAQAQGVLGQAANIKEFAKRGKDPVGALHPASAEKHVHRWLGSKVEYLKA